ncbi:MAG: glycosyltransferase family 2 protein [Planctomycetes bacterium]|nr:glycosyltransferase family 2 protein [Planctomycetota bacterium]
MNPHEDLDHVSAVISAWNRREDLRENLESISVQTHPFAEIIVVDNYSTDGTVEMVKREFPDVRLIEMPDSTRGACETFNIGFKAARHALILILDDDVKVPPDWLERAVKKLKAEPPTTAMISATVVEPGMPEEYRSDPEVNAERYTATFRGCATLVKRDVLERAGYYDERFFIYGNERDLAARILGLGYRIKIVPELEVFHKTPFGMKAGPRSLYYHVRNLWWYLVKNCSVRDICRFFLFHLGLTGRKRRGKHLKDSVGIIGLKKTLVSTRWGWWIFLRATGAAVLGLPYALKHRKVCRAEDFHPPIY